MDAAILATITTGFTDLTDMIKQVVLVGVPACVGVIVLAQGARYGLRWVTGLIYKA